MRSLAVIIASTRPGRLGLPVGTWFHGFAQKHAKFAVTLIDLAAVNLPFLDEPEHPRLQRYQHAHTKAWSATVAAADAFVFVTPEYNFSMPAPLVNAVDFLFTEWNDKPLGLVSYGGASGGMRSAQMIKQLATAVKMMPIPEGVALSFAAKQVKEGVFVPVEVQEKSATGMLDELLRWADALAPMRLSK